MNSSRRLLNVASNDKGQAAGGRNPAPVRRCHGVCCCAPPAVAGSRGAAGGMWQPPRATAGAGCTVHESPQQQQPSIARTHATAASPAQQAEAAAERRHPQSPAATHITGAGAELLAVIAQHQAKAHVVDADPAERAKAKEATWAPTPNSLSA